MKQIEVRVFAEHDNPTNIDTILVANLHVPTIGPITVEPGTSEVELDRLKQALAEISMQDSLTTREAQQRVVDGERVRMAVRVTIPKGDPRYPRAVADHLQKRFGFICDVIP